MNELVIQLKISGSGHILLLFMTKAEFISKTKVWQQRQARNQIILVVSFVLLFLLWFLFGWWVGASAPNSRFHGVFAAGPVFIFVSLIAAQKLVIRKTFKKYGLSCPLCSKPLGDVTDVVVATGNCGNCGERILDQD